jgi:hypothetical protein
MPLLHALREAEDQEAADRVVAGVRSGELGVAGIDRVAEALEAGQVHELVIDEEAGVDPDLRAELVRQAAKTGADVLVVQGPPRACRPRRRGCHAALPRVAALSSGPVPA